MVKGVACRGIKGTLEYSLMKGLVQVDGRVVELPYFKNSISIGRIGAV